MKLIIYQILVRLAWNTTKNPIKNGNIEENGCGKFNFFSIKRLQSIRKMGCTHIWFTGIIEHATQTDYSRYNIQNSHPNLVKGKAGSPYSIRDYYDVCADLAKDVSKRINEFENLIHRTHLSNLKAIIDFVPNHVARQYHSDINPKLYSDLGENDGCAVSFSPHNDFYYLKKQPFTPLFSLKDKEGNVYGEFPAKATGNDCFSPHPTQNDWYETVKINYGIDYMRGGTKYFNPIPSSWYKMTHILLYWASKKVDGFRCDMVEMVPVEFWTWAIPQIKQKFPHIIFIAEIYNPENYISYLLNGKFDYLYDKVGMYDTLRDIMIGKKFTKNITRSWQNLGDIQPYMLNFLENHDEQRIASDFFAKNALKGRPALVVASTLNTNPFMIYFGQELGEKGMDNEGFSKIDGRTSIFDYWSLSVFRHKLSKEQKLLRQYYANILNLCNYSIAISEGKFFDLMYANNHLTQQYAFLRYKSNELLLIIANFEAKEVETFIFIPSHAMYYFGIKGSIKSDKELLTGETRSSILQLNKPYYARIKEHNAEIIRFQVISNDL